MPDRWFDTNFVKRRKLAFDNSKQTESLIDFPVWIKLNSSRITYSALQAAGQDLRFVDQGHLAQLKYEIEVWNPSGESSIWVKIPLVDSDSNCDHCYMYYDNPAVADAQTPATVWSNGYEAVWHMNQDPSGTPPQILDSLSTFDLTTSGTMTTGDLIDGEVGKALDMDGTDDRLQNVTLGDGATETEISAIAVFQTKSGQIDTAGVILQRILPSPLDFWRLEMLPSGKVRAIIDAGTTTANVVSDESFEDDLRHTMVFEFERVGANDSRIRLWIDGILKKTVSIALDAIPVTPSGAVFQIGPNLETEFDEARVSFVKRTADWYAAQHLSLTDKFVTFGPEEHLDGRITIPVTTDENSRRSVPQFFLRTVPPKPDGTIETRDRRHIAWLYTRPGAVGSFSGKIIEGS